MTLKFQIERGPFDEKFFRMKDEFLRLNGYEYSFFEQQFLTTKRFQLKL